MPLMVVGILGALWAAAAMTFGDWFWAAFELRHLAIYGLIHGLLLFTWIGFFLGRTSRRAVHGAVGGAIVGLLAAASYYALVPVFGYSAMFVSWVALWFGLAWLTEYLGSMSARHTSTRTALVRGAIAAVGSGLAFYAVSDVWLEPPAVPNYSRNFATWTVAFLPGMLALFVGSGRRRRAPL
jgi:hypothetical protein